VIFLDTNVPVYAADDTDAEKQRAARAVLSRALRHEGFAISAQVLNEFANVALKKLKRTPDEVGRFVSVLRRIYSVDLKVDWTERALSVKEKYGIQFYDALIVVAASSIGCSEIWSEDMAAGQTYENVLVRNPFA